MRGEPNTHVIKCLTDRPVVNVHNHISSMNINRRVFIKSAALAGAGLAASPDLSAGAKSVVIKAKQGILIDPEPSFALSPYLYMQFMEPLGRTDGSVEAAWDFSKHAWREDVLEATRELAPSMVRFGGIFSSYYRWREGVGKRSSRVPMQNLLWGGYESNQVGTAEFVDFCRQVGADPLMCVNFESEGSPGWSIDGMGSDRKGTAQEAAEWVDYCNNPDNALRKAHGIDGPLRIPFWQIGNETSYAKDRFHLDTAVQKTVAFSKEMLRADPSIKLIGWGGLQRWGEGEGTFWAKEMIERAGEHLDYVAFHHMFNPYGRDPDNPLKGVDYRKDPALTWEYLMNACAFHEKKVVAMREQVEPYQMPMALTECHYSFPGRNRNEVMSTWATGVSYARIANLHERHGDLLKIATMADFCGTRWQVNALMIPIPRSYGEAFLMPVAKVMKLYRKYSGTNYCETTQTPAYLDITASRKGNTLFAHVVNTHRSSPVKTTLSIKGATIASIKVHEMAADPEFEIIAREPDPLQIQTKEAPADGTWTFPAASVSAVEININ